MGKREKDTGEMGERPADPGVDPAAVEPLPRSVRAAWIGATATLNAGDQEADEALDAFSGEIDVHNGAPFISWVDWLTVLGCFWLFPAGLLIGFESAVTKAPKNHPQT